MNKNFKTKTAAFIFSVFLITTVRAQTPTGNVGVGTTTPASLLSVGGTPSSTDSPFQVNGSGDIVRIKNVNYVWPSSHAAGVAWQLTDDGSGNLSWASPASAASASLPVSRTIFVDYVNGTTLALGALPQRFDKPFNTKAEAITAALTLTPTATNRVMINVACGLSSEGIVFTQITNGVDFNLNGGSINVSSGATAAVDDGGFAVNSIIYDANNIETSGTNTAPCIYQTAASNIIVNANKIKSITKGAYASGGVQLINSDIEVSGIYPTGASSAGTAILTVNGNILSSGTSCNSTNSSSIIVNGNLTTSYQGIIAFSSSNITINGNISSSGTTADACAMQSTGNVVINGNISGGIHAAYSNGSGNLTINGNLTCNTNYPAMQIILGVVKIGAGSRIQTTGVTMNAIIKSGGTLILNSPTLIATGTNSIFSTGAQSVIIYGSGQQNKIQDANTTFKVGSMVTSTDVQ